MKKVMFGKVEQTYAVLGMGSAKVVPLRVFNHESAELRFKASKMLKGCELGVKVQREGRALGEGGEGSVK